MFFFNNNFQTSGPFPDIFLLLHHLLCAVGISDIKKILVVGGFFGKTLKQQFVKNQTPLFSDAVFFCQKKLLLRVIVIDNPFFLTAEKKTTLKETTTKYFSTRREAENSNNCPQNESTFISSCQSLLLK